jgi:hypothetical protein
MSKNINMKYTFSIALVLLLASGKASAQGMAVNASGAAANASAMLDVSSTSKGMLIPRMTTAQRNAIASPATGLMIFQTDGTAGFYYFNGSTWTDVGGGAPTGAAGGDLTGTYPNPTISSSSGTGNNIVTAINASGGGLSGTKLATNSVSVNALSATGTANSTTFLRGDNTWQVAGAGTVTSSGTANFIPVFTSSTNVDNSNMYQNGTRFVINNGTITHGMLAVKAAGVDTIALYLNDSNNPTIYGTERVEYTGSTDHDRVGILSTTIRSISDQNGIGIEGAGNAIGVQGLAEASTASQVEGTEGDSYGSGTYSVGVAGYSSNYIGAPTNSYGVYGFASGGATNYAVYADGAMRVNGVLSKASGTFEIDHPLDPANKYLYHSFVESPDMMNVYNGNITTDASGIAIVKMPGYFEALNKDFRYQLTTIGQPAQVYVSKKLDGNQFEIKTDKPNVEVSWQVTGVRQDAWANAHRVVAEVDKVPADKGRYLHPKELGLSEDLRIGGDMKKHGQKNDPAVLSQPAGDGQK